MLSGKKHLAVFHDYFYPEESISEEIIPEKAFQPYVLSGRIVRFEKILFSKKMNHQVLYVCFTTPEEDWRAKAYLWFCEGIHTQRFQPNPYHDYYLGKLLGYSDPDITDFTSQNDELFSSAIRAKTAF